MQINEIFLMVPLLVKANHLSCFIDGMSNGIYDLYQMRSVGVLVVSQYDFVIEEVYESWRVTT